MKGRGGGGGGGLLRQMPHARSVNVDYIRFPYNSTNQHASDLLKFIHYFTEKCNSLLKTIPTKSLPMTLCMFYGCILKSGYSLLFL